MQSGVGDVGLFYIRCKRLRGDSTTSDAKHGVLLFYVYLVIIFALFSNMIFFPYYNLFLVQIKKKIKF